MTTKPENVTKICSKCEIQKQENLFYNKGNVCRDCNNLKRRMKYLDDAEHRKKLIQQATDFKKNKVAKRQKIKEEEQYKIGIDNKICKYCNEIKLKIRFRHNRLKCRDCERDEPVEKFKRYIRTRIYNCLYKNNKTKKTIEYLGCSNDEYFKWIFSYDERYNMENHGKLWHIDHVIPLSLFNLEDEEQQLIAFNWRNTMPLLATENLIKNNRISQEQIQKHYSKIIKYHKNNNINLPQVFIDLFAKHLDAGIPLEPI